MIKYLGKKSYSKQKEKFMKLDSPKPLKRIAVLKDFKYGVEIEFPYRIKDEETLLYNFNHYNKNELNNQWKFNKELTNEYPKEVAIGEFVSLILNESDVRSLGQVNVILQLVKAFQHPVLKAKERNTHFHFDMDLLGDSLEHLPSFLSIYRAYEIIFSRIISCETSLVRKKGISDRIAKSLKNISISDILRTYNGGEYNLENLKKFRKLPINLFNVGAFYEAKSKNAIPCVISEKSDSMQKQLQTVRFVVDAGLYDSSKYQILKKLTPTVEFRITPSTTDLGYFQQNLLLFSDLFLMAQNLERIQGLKQKVDTRNKLIDEKGPSVFEKGIDEGISDITHFLQPELRDRLQMQYMFAEQVPLYSNSINR